MCFSAEASFTAGAVLTVAGVYALVITKNHKYLPLAATPLLFGIQQLTEGGVWLSLTMENMAQYKELFMYSFLFFSQIFRVAWVPFICRCIETHSVRKKILNVLTVIGVILALYFAYWVFIRGATAMIHEHHIRYRHAGVEILYRPSTILYILTTIGSILISSNRKLRLLGVGLFITLVAAYLFYKYYFISVWCFFAAIISIYVIHLIRKDARKL